MTTSETYFKEFVKNISPNTESSANAQKAHNNLRGHLEGKAEYSDSFLYGSYIRSTAIHDIDDVDICILLDIDIETEEGKPKKVLRKLKKDISAFYTDIIGYDEDNTEYNRRSILVKNALPEVEDSNLTLDVIPAIQTKYDYLLVPDRELEEWVKTNPKGHIEFSQNMNSEEKSNKLFISVVKIFKHFKKLRLNKKHPKGFWVETLVGLNYKKQDTIVESFYYTLSKILEKYGDSEKVPDLEDMGLEGDKIKTSMEFKDFQKFIKLLQNIKEDLLDAIESEEKEYSNAIYRYIFGEQYFPITLEKIYTDNSSEEFITQKYSYIENLNYGYSFKIIGKETNTILGNGNFDNFIKTAISYNSSENADKLFFSITCNNCPQETIFLWKVRNYGYEASNKNALRGKIGEYTNDSNNTESIAYKGIHLVECFAIYDNQIISKNIYRVIIT